MDSQYAGYSLEELRTLRSTWLERGRKDAPKLLAVIRTLGENVTPRPASRAFDPEEHKQLAAGQAHAYYVRTSGAYNPAQKAYDTHGRLWIESRGEVVVNLYYANDVLDPTVFDSVYIPGPWIECLLAMETTAQAVIAERSARKDNDERQGLIALLGIGKVI